MTDKRTYAIEDILGALLLIAALFGLGLFNFKSDEPLVEAGLRSQANAIVADSVHGLEVKVDGRRIYLSGLADTPQERREVLNALKAMDGRGKIVSDVTVLAPADPFTFSARYTPDTALEFAGAVPTEALRTALGLDYGEGVSALVLASGMPDADWPDVIQGALRALTQLSDGRLDVEATSLELSGTALTPEVVERIELLMADVPVSYTFETDLRVLDDGSPLRLTASRNDAVFIALSGKLPSDLISRLPAGEFEQSPLAVPFDGWQAAVLSGLGALETLQNGQLSITGTSLILTGEAWSQDAFDRAKAILAELPGAMSVSRQITLADSGAPFGLKMTLAGAKVTATGKVPRSLAPGVLAALSDAPVQASGLVVAQISPGDDWWRAASLGAHALRHFENAELAFDGTILGLSGIVQDPPRLAQLRHHLEGLPATVGLALNVELIDDGTPLRLKIAFDGQAAQISGKLPDGALLDQLTAPLGAPIALGKLVHTPKPGAAQWPQAALVAVTALSRFEKGDLDMTDTHINLHGTVRNPAAEHMVLQTLGILPEAYRFETEFSFQDDGRPFALRLDFDGSRGVLSGKVPRDLGPASQAAILGFPIEVATLEIAEIPADADWWAAARSGLKALAGLKQGVLTLDAHQISLQGIAGDKTMADAAQTRMQPFQEMFKIELDIKVAQ